MTGPVEIISEALINECPSWHPSIPRVAIRALEAAGWRLVHPDNVTEEMVYSVGLDHMISKRRAEETLQRAIKAAPKYGDGE